jgi:beta-glucosidase
MVTENGICAEDDGERAIFIKEHIASLGAALRAGAPVIGYLYWALIDNFEWTHGYRQKFGLIAVDRATGGRSVKPSGRLYAGMIEKEVGALG